MAKGKQSKSDRSDPTKNKSLAVRTVLKRIPNAKGKEVVAAVKKEFGHDVNVNMVYMIKTKKNMASDGRPQRAKNKTNPKLDSALAWVDAIKLARQLLAATGSVPNAVALLKALEQ
jgi:hypothetical protein